MTKNFQNLVRDDKIFERFLSHLKKLDDLFNGDHIVGLNVLNPLFDHFRSRNFKIGQFFPNVTKIFKLLCQP